MSKQTNPSIEDILDRFLPGREWVLLENVVFEEGGLKLKYRGRYDERGKLVGELKAREQQAIREALRAFKSRLEEAMYNDLRPNEDRMGDSTHSIAGMLKNDVIEEEIQLVGEVFEEFIKSKEKQ